MSTISERLGISNEIHELKFGKSFTNTSNNSSKYNSNKNSFNNDNGPTESFHTIRYDFKPVSVDTNQTATIEFNEKNKITVTAPNVEGSGMSCTVFQGSRKPHLKECVLVFDHETGDFTLERLTNNIVVKKTRAEGSSKIVNQQRPITPANLNQKSVSPKLNNNNQFNGSTKSPPNSSSAATLAASTTTTNGTLSSHRSPKDKLNQQQPMNSMPIFNSSTLAPSSLNNNANTNNNQLSNGNSLTKNTFKDYDVGVLSSSSSSSSSSDDDSSSSSFSSSSSEDDEPVINNTSNNNNNNNNNKITKNNTAINHSSMGAISNHKSMNISSSDSEDEDDEKLSSLNNNLINSLNNGLSNVGISNSGPIGFSMPKLSDLNGDLQLSESGSESD